MARPGEISARRDARVPASFSTTGRRPCAWPWTGAGPGTRVLRLGALELGAGRSARGRARPDPELRRLELPDLVAQARRLLELEIGRRLLHPRLQRADVALEVHAGEYLRRVLAEIDVTWSRSATCSMMSPIRLRMLSGVMPFASLKALCFARRRSVSSSAHSSEPVMRSAYRITRPSMFLAARPMVWMSEVSEPDSPPCRRPGWRPGRIPGCPAPRAGD